MKTGIDFLLSENLWQFYALRLNAVKDFSPKKEAAWRSRSRETSESFLGKCPNSN